MGAAGVDDAARQQARRLDGRGPTLITAYGGLENVAVSQGSKIKSGQKIADLKGDTLRFEVREIGKCVDPLKYLNKR